MGKGWMVAAGLGALVLTGPSGCTVRPAGQVVVDSPPPRPRYQAPAQPRPGYLWVRGRWVFREGQWRWRAGRWIKDRPRHRYVPGRWVQRRGRYHWIDGRWQRRGASNAHRRDRRRRR